MSSHSSAVRTGSRPESGSSKSTMSGSSTSARAKPARLRMPPESSFGILYDEPSKPAAPRGARGLRRAPGSLVRHFAGGPFQADLAQAAVDDLGDLVLALVGVLAQ